ncbi:MAG: AraC family transcriptional regulator, partial [Cyclobacteriaceae bacterium]
MKPHHEKLTLDPKYSFILQKDIFSYYPTPWHYHPEYELVLVLKSNGIRTVGDSEEPFTDGDLVFLGPNLPHSYQNDRKYYKGNNSLTAEAIVIHFKEDFLGRDFFNLPEMVFVKNLLDKAKFGLKITDNTQKKISRIMQEMLDLNGNGRIIQLLTILEILSHSEESIQLANPGFVQQYAACGNDRITKIHEYIMENFQKPINLKDVAEVANMSIPSFCRFFKSCTRKSFSHFLNTIRIGYACKLLLENQHNISWVCYESGFNNMSNFNRQFKLITGKSPIQYKSFKIEQESKS